MTSRKRKPTAPVPPALDIAIDELIRLPDPALAVAWDHFPAVCSRARAQIARLQADLQAATDRYQAVRMEILMRRLERDRMAVLVKWKTVDKASRLEATAALVMDWLGSQHPGGAVIRRSELEGMILLRVTLPSKETLIYSLYENGDVRCKDTSTFNVVHNVPRSW